MRGLPGHVAPARGWADQRLRERRDGERLTPKPNGLQHQRRLEETSPACSSNPRARISAASTAPNPAFDQHAPRDVPQLGRHHGIGRHLHRHRAADRGQQQSRPRPGETAAPPGCPGMTRHGYRLRSPSSVASGVNCPSPPILEQPSIRRHSANRAGCAPVRGRNAPHAVQPASSAP